MTFLEWLTSTIGTAGLLSIVGVLARHWMIERLANSIKYKYETELETHKANLIRDAEFRLSEFRHNLEMAASEQKHRFSHVFTDTANAIKDIHAMMVDAEKALSTYAASLQRSGSVDTSNERRAFEERMQQLEDCFRYKRIYVPRPTADKVENALTSFRDNKLMFDVAGSIMKDIIEAKDEKTLIDIRNELTSLSEKIRTLLQELEVDFHHILGFPTKRQTTKVGSGAF